MLLVIHSVLCTVIVAKHIEDIPFKSFPTVEVALTEYDQSSDWGNSREGAIPG